MSLKTFSNHVKCLTQKDLPLLLCQSVTTFDLASFTVTHAMSRSTRARPRWEGTHVGFHDEVAIISIIVTSIKEFMQWFAPAELALTRRAPML